MDDIPSKAEAIRTIALMTAILATRLHPQEDCRPEEDRRVGTPDPYSIDGAGEIASLAADLYDAALTEVNGRPQLYQDEPARTLHATEQILD